jgi:hypothetical protein
MGDTLMKINALDRRSFRPRGGRPVRRPGSCRGCLPPGNHQLQLGDTLVAANQAVAQSPTEVLMPKQTL